MYKYRLRQEFEPTVPFHRAITTPYCTVIEVAKPRVDIGTLGVIKSGDLTSVL